MYKHSKNGSSYGRGLSSSFAPTDFRQHVSHVLSNSVMSARSTIGCLPRTREWSRKVLRFVVPPPKNISFLIIEYTKYESCGRRLITPSRTGARCLCIVANGPLGRDVDSRPCHHASSIKASSPASLHSRECFVIRFTPATLPAHRLSAGVRNV